MAESAKNVLAIRGANTVESNDANSINKATLEMLKLIIEKNNLTNDDIVSAIFTMTPDLNAEFPAKIARIELGWDDIPMICTQEIAVPGSLTFCIRLLLTVNANLQKKDVKHIYLGRSSALRPDWAL